METSTRPAPYALCPIIAALLCLCLLTASCEGQTKTTTETHNVTDLTQAQKRLDSLATAYRIPSQIDGATVTNIEPLGGGIQDFGDADLKSEGLGQAKAEAKADIEGFLGISPCRLLAPSDFQNWPGGTPQLVTTRENLGQIILGCNFTDATSGAGRIRVFVSDNQTPALAVASVEQFADDPSSEATRVAGWNRPAAYSAKTGDFVWAHEKAFINLVIEHPALKQNQERWARELAQKIDARLPF